MSIDHVSELIHRQRLVERMVPSQDMPRHEMVESVVQRQHLAELHTALATLSATEIGTLLETLPVEDARLLWKQVPQARENEVLWEVSDSLRVCLAEDRQPGFSDSQIHAFELVDGKLRQVTNVGFWGAKEGPLSSDS
jgi:magnesium transporter